MTWFEEGDDVTWETPQKIREGVIVHILKPGEFAEDVLDENERTKLAYADNDRISGPRSTRALVKAIDKFGSVTYHTPKLVELEIIKMAKDKREPTIREIMDKLIELEEKITSCAPRVRNL